MKHVCVMGAGVVGVASAWRLLEQGYRVTLVDAAEAPGTGASFGNGAQLSYSYVAPLADPSVWRLWPHYVFSPNSPLKLRPSVDPALWSWLLRFLAACNAPRARETTVALLRLAQLSRAQLTQWRQTLPLDFQHRVAGKLVMIDSAAGLEAARRQVAFQAQHGCRQQVLDRQACIALEPALAEARRDWVGGVYTGDEEVGDCAAFCRSLLRHMQSQPNFTWCGGAPINRLQVRNGRLVAIQAGHAEITADDFVLALGAGSTTLARRIGLRLPLYPLKGYSITVPLDEATGTQAPMISITDLPRKIVYARVGEALRVAGRLELVGMRRDIPARAVAELRLGVAELFPQLSLPADAALAPWAGFRPATPTGLPIIGASPIAGLYLNVGHGSLGWTLAAGSAALLAQQIAGAAPSIDAHAFQFAST